MTRRGFRTATGALALALAGAGCSLVKLSDDVTQGGCQRNADCDVLNTEKSLAADPCMRWQCDEEAELCAYGMLDLDDDGQSPLDTIFEDQSFTCEENVARQDCDDEDPLRTRGAREHCDGVDNDCDGRIDEGALEVTRDEVLTLNTDQQVTQASFARDPQSGALAIGYSLLQNVTPLAGLHVLPPTLDGHAEAEPLRIDGSAAPGQDVAVSAVGERFAYGFVSLTPKVHLVAGITDPTGSTVALEPDLALNGVQCLADETCLARATTPEEREMADPPWLTTPALAALDQQVLLTYARWEGPLEVLCGDLVRADEQPELRASLLAVAAGAGEPVLQELTTTPLELSRSADLAPPAVAGIGQIGSEREAVGFVIAYSDAEGRVVLDRVQSEMGEIAVTQLAVLSIAGSEPHFGVAMARGVGVAGIQTLGIAYQRGCGNTSRVLVSLYRLRLTDGELSAEAVARDLEVGGDAAQRAPAIAYSLEHNAWAVVYRDSSGLRARLIDPSGRLHDPDGDPYLLIASERSEAGPGVSLLLTPAVMPEPGGDDWFAAIAHVLREAEENPRRFELVRLGCSP